MDWAGENRGTDKDTLVAGALASGNWEAAPTAPRDPFSVHVFACLVTLAAQEAIASGATIGETLGLRSADLDALVTTYPSSIAVALEAQPSVIEFDEEEEQLRALFDRYRVDLTKDLMPDFFVPDWMPPSPFSRTGGFLPCQGICNPMKSSG